MLMYSDVLPVFLDQAEKVKLLSCAQLIKQYAIKAYRGVDAEIHIFLTSATAGSEWSASSPSHFTPGESPQYPLDGWLGGSQNQSGQCREGNIFALTGT
jgi:hypothetical protein